LRYTALRLGFERAGDWRSPPIEEKIADQSAQRYWGYGEE
jgi:hypothetical protein